MRSARQAPIARSLAGRRRLAALLAAGLWAGAAAAHFASCSAAPPGHRTVTVDLDQVLNRFEPARALGAGVDGMEYGDIPRTWKPANIAAMRSAGFGPLAYRLRTELGVEAWHWNPRGSWSDPAHHQGYWTSSPDGPRYGLSYGYRLPRRGDTIDQANDTGFSRLDDGNVQTFWKSNPYLDSRFTGEPDTRHPQWIMLDFERPVPVDAVRIVWGNPYATRFRAQWWTGEDAIYPVGGGRWQDFPAGSRVGHRPMQTVRVGARPRAVRFVRILLTRDSNTAPRGSKDVRDRLGYAVRELYVGRFVGSRFVDAMRHVGSQRQTMVFASSTDPWHRARDFDRNYEHASFDRAFTSGLTNGAPMLTPVAVLYGTPHDAAAEVRFLRARGYPLRQIELGEEPDGQLATPEDYGALYVQFARALKAVDPTLEFGGPGYQSSVPDWVAWPDSRGRRYWTGRFVGYLRSRGAMQDFDFFSFEWYPFDDVCANPEPQLVQHPGLLAGVMARQERHGLPPEIPKVMTEYGYSAFAAEAEVDRPGALLNAEIMGKFLAIGGDVSYYYGYEPNVLIQEEEGAPCHTFGNLMLFQAFGEDENRLRPLATYRVARMVTQDWVQPGSGVHLVRPTSSDVRDSRGRELVSAYAVTRPDGRLAMMLLNKDAHRAFTVRLQRAGGGTLPGPVQLVQLGVNQYVWHPHGENGFPSPDLPPVRSLADPAGLRLPPYSLSVVRTMGPP